MTEREMFLEQVTRSVDGCWIWNGSRERAGYGWIFVREKKMAAHRLAYELFVGAIPVGLFVCHRCDNPPCVRPDHLFVGTREDNFRDMRQKGRARPRGSKKFRACVVTIRPRVDARVCPWTKVSLWYDKTKRYPSSVSCRKQSEVGERHRPVRPA
jgi:hypothetical protein